MDESERYGLHRVIEEPGVLPQQARRLDPALPIRASELAIEVDSLNVDAASFRQLMEAASGDSEVLGAGVAELVAERGKLHNPVTGSGGMLIGRVLEVGAAHPAHGALQPGDRVATLVSLTLTPLSLKRVKRVVAAADRVEVEGHAILFASGLWAALPTDMSDEVALAALDVCGAPALVARHAGEGQDVVVLGAGKSGALCLAEARRSLQGKGRLIALDISQPALDALLEAGLCDEARKVDGRDAVAVMSAVHELTDGRLADLTVNCASVGGTEMSTLLATKEGGSALFFSMATSFTAAALGAEGLGKDVTLLMGNGYVPGHAELTLDLLRTEPALRALFERRFGPGA